LPGVSLQQCVPALFQRAVLLVSVAALTMGAAPAPGPGPAPNYRLSRLCLFSAPHKGMTMTVAMSMRSGTGWSGVCWAKDYPAKTELQSWWRRDGNNWKVQGKPIPGNSSADFVVAQHYNVPAADVPVLLDALAKNRKNSPYKP